MSKKRIKIETERDEVHNGDESSGEDELREGRDISASFGSPDENEPDVPETVAGNSGTDSVDATVSPEDVSEVIDEDKDKDALLARMTENWQRERANFLNYKRRVEEEKDKLRKYAYFDFAFDLLRVVDYFESSISFGENLPEDAKSVILGVEYTLRELTQVLSAHGVKPIEVEIGDEYDSSIMEAVERRKAPSKDPDTVLEIHRKGWRLYERVLRPAQVVVAGLGTDNEDENGEGGDNNKGSEEQGN
jgi:molecular chaperone GrpE